MAIPLTSKPQVSGWKLNIRRIRNAIVRRGQTLQVDPTAGQMRAFFSGFIAVVACSIACLMIAYFKPAPKANNAKILMDNQTGSLYVVLDSKLYPVLNLTSARLITKKDDNPAKVARSELDKYPTGGNLLGIPGAPQDTVQNSMQDSLWGLCSSIDAETGAYRTIVVAGYDAPPGLVDINSGRLMKANNQVWLIWNNARMLINPRYRPITYAFGIDDSTPVLPASKSFISSIPRKADLTIPKIPHVNSIASWSKHQKIHVGEVVSTIDITHGKQYYLALREGIEPISPVVAGMLRSIRSYGKKTPTVLPQDTIFHTFIVSSIDFTQFPPIPLHFDSALHKPTTCFHWSMKKNDTIPVMQISYSTVIPYPVDRQVQFLGKANTGIDTAHAAILPAGGGFLLHVTGSSENYVEQGDEIYIDSRGIRYGLPLNSSETKKSLGLYGVELRAPWNIISLLPQGPTLSRHAALKEYDIVPS